MRYLLLLALVACSGPSQYHYPPANPAPTYTPPGTGLPMPTAPGVRNIPRSPSRRVLPPPGDKPGLWGAEPRAARDATSYPRVLGVDMPMHDRENPAEMRAAALCAALVKSAAAPETVAAKIAGLSAEERKCTSALAYATCLNELTKAPLKTEDEARALELAARAAFAAASSACDGVTSPALATVTRALHDEIMESFSLVRK